MHFAFDDDELAVRDAVRAFCSTRLDPDDPAAPADGPAVWRGLAALGVLGMLADRPGAVAALVFEELGAHLAPGPLVWSTVAAPFVPGADDGSVRVAGVVAGPAGPVAVAHGDGAGAVLVLHPDRLELGPADALTGGTEGEPLDPSTPVTVLPAAPGGTVVGGADQARWAQRWGQILTAALLVGTARGALDAARRYTLEREQFGVAIGSFQAVKHLLADAYVRVELARAATQAAAALADGDDPDGADRAAAMAKVLAGEAGVANGRTAVQLFGGMGFTWDMAPHRFLKRSWLLEHQFGTGPAHARTLGDALGREVAA